MSKGSPVLRVRIPPALLAEIDRIIARTADSRPDGPWTRSSFILYALRERLSHMERSRAYRKLRRPPQPGVN